MNIPIDDRGFTLGVGLFETILAEQGRFAFWQAHLDRLARGCRRLGLPLPDPAACATAAAVALARDAPGAARASLRLTWTGGSGARGLAGPAHPAPRLIATAAPLAPPPLQLSLAIVVIRRNAAAVTSRFKTLSYLDNVVAREEAAALGADEALMLNTDGDLCCGAAANLFWFEGRDLCTPALECGVLDGIMRAEVIRRARVNGVAVREVAAKPDALARGDGAFVTSSLIGCVWVARVEGKDFFFEKKRQNTFSMWDRV